MKTVYIHIGTFKTGTTSIQQFIKRNRKRLRGRGIYVPTTPLLAHHPLPLSLIKKHSRWRGGWREFDGDPDEIWGQMLTEISKTRCRKILISSESFCDLVNENCRQSSDTFGKYIKQKFEPYDVKIICYLRSIEPYITSIYQESIKVTSRTIGFSQELEDLYKRESIHLKPSIYLDFFAKLFGQENMIIREYSREKLTGGDSVKDILEMFGCADLYDEQEAIRSNPSLTATELKLKKALNACALDYYEFHDELTRLIKTCRDISEDDSFEQDIPEYIAAEIANEEKKIEDRYGLTFSPKSTRQASVNSGAAPSSYDLLVLSLLSKIIAQNELLLSRGEKTLRPAPSRFREKLVAVLRKAGIRRPPER